MTTVALEDAQARLPELIERLAPGEECVITRNVCPVARLVGPIGETRQPLFGRGRGKVVVVAEDDEHLKNLDEYAPAG